MLTGLGVRTTEEKDRELDRLLIQVGRGTERPLPGCTD